MQVGNIEDITQDSETLQTALSLTLLSRSTGPRMGGARADKGTGESADLVGKQFGQ